MLCLLFLFKPVEQLEWRNAKMIVQKKVKRKTIQDSKWWRGTGVKQKAISKAYQMVETNLSVHRA